jgi:CBS-domain-containing membrane protein
MLVRDVMSSPAITIRPHDELAEAARVLDRLNLTSLPVVDQHLHLLGIITEADVIGQLPASDQHPHGAHQRTDEPRVRDVMTARVLTVSADDDIAEVVALMSGTTLKSLPVLLHDRVIGVMSRRDVVRAMARGDLDARSTADPSPV